MKNISYNVDDYGVLKVFVGGCILAEVSECEHMNDEQINKLVDELILESGVIETDDIFIPIKFLNKLYKTHKDSIDEYFNRSVERDDFEAIEQFLYEFRPSIEVFMVEVGVELEVDDKEYSCYNIIVNGKEKGYQSLYDENVIAFTDEQEAKDYIDKYVKEGIKNTYGFMWKVSQETDTLSFEELFNTYLLEGIFYDREEILYFKGGI